MADDGTKSSFKGVIAHGEKWQPKLGYLGRKVILPTAERPEDAARWAVYKLRGQSEGLNFPLSDETRAQLDAMSVAEFLAEVQVGKEKNKWANETTGGTSQFYGVSFYKKQKRWVVSVEQKKSTGFLSETAAADMADSILLEVHGPKAMTNAKYHSGEEGRERAWQEIKEKPRRDIEAGIKVSGRKAKAGKGGQAASAQKSPVSARKCRAKPEGRTKHQPSSSEEEDDLASSREQEEPRQSPPEDSTSEDLDSFRGPGPRGGSFFSDADVESADSSDGSAERGVHGQASRAKCGFRGVRAQRGKWYATVRHLRKAFHLPTAERPEDAARWYDRAVYKLRGQSEGLNFPLSDETRAQLDAMSVAEFLAEVQVEKEKNKWANSTAGGTSRFHGVCYKKNIKAWAVQLEKKSFYGVLSETCAVDMADSILVQVHGPETMTNAKYHSGEEGRERAWQELKEKLRQDIEAGIEVSGRKAKASKGGHTAPVENNRRYWTRGRRLQVEAAVGPAEAEKAAMDEPVMGAEASKARDETTEAAETEQDAVDEMLGAAAEVAAGRFVHDRSSIWPLPAGPDAGAGAAHASDAEATVGHQAKQQPMPGSHETGKSEGGEERGNKGGRVEEEEYDDDAEEEEEEEEDLEVWEALKAALDDAWWAGKARERSPNSGPLQLGAGAAGSAGQGQGGRDATTPSAAASKKQGGSSAPPAMAETLMPHSSSDALIPLPGSALRGAGRGQPVLPGAFHPGSVGGRGQAVRPSRGRVFARRGRGAARGMGSPGQGQRHGKGVSERSAHSANLDAFGMHGAGAVGPQAAAPSAAEPRGSAADASASATLGVAPAPEDHLEQGKQGREGRTGWLEPGADGGLPATSPAAAPGAADLRGSAAEALPSPMLSLGAASEDHAEHGKHGRGGGAMWVEPRAGGALHGHGSAGAALESGREAAADLRERQPGASLSVSSFVLLKNVDASLEPEDVKALIELATQETVADVAMNESVAPAQQSKGGQCALLCCASPAQALRIQLHITSISALVCCTTGRHWEANVLPSEPTAMLYAFAHMSNVAPRAVTEFAHGPNIKGRRDAARHAGLQGGKSPETLSEASANAKSLEPNAPKAPSVEPRVLADCETHPDVTKTQYGVYIVPWDVLERLKWPFRQHQQELEKVVKLAEFLRQLSLIFLTQASSINKEP